MKKLFVLPALLTLLILTGCTSMQVMDGDGMENTYRQISQDFMSGNLLVLFVTSMFFFHWA